MKIQMMSRLGTLALLASLTALAGCGGGGGDAGCSAFSTSCSSSGSSNTTTTSSDGTVTTSSAGTVVLSLSSPTISASTPGTVTALVKNADGAPVANTVVTFEVANATATVTPARVITDANGNASATLQPVAGQIGADYVKASADVSSASALTTRAAFTVSAVNVALGDAAASPASINAYGAAVVTVAVSGASPSSPVTVTFSSTCASAGKAVLSPTSQTVTGTSASTTYQDKACGSTDRISAAITGTSQQRQVELAVAAPSAQSLEFVSATPDKICLAGSGCGISSEVSFRLKDQYNNPIANRVVSFSLDIPNVATLGNTQVPTNADGIATVSVTAKTIPSPVRVNAQVTLDNGTRLSTVSNVLAINAGLPTQRAFSFSADKYNPDGWTRDGTESEVRVQLTDRFANPVPDGTSVSFVAEGASVIPARCTTTNGICTIKLITSEYRPPNGRITVVAYAQGEESFNDADGDNLYTSGEVFFDLGPIFVDKDENGTMAAQGEYLIGSNADGKWSANTYVRVSRVFTLSDASRPPRLFTVNGDGSCSTTRLPSLVMNLTASGECRVRAKFCMRDANAAADELGGNPIPSGATLSASTKAKGGTVAVDFTPIPGNVTSPTFHVLSADLSDCSKPLEASGPIDLTVKMPNGQTYVLDLGILK